MTDQDPDSDAETEPTADEDIGASYLQWRCTNCGETGTLEDGVPESCSNCGASKDDIEEGPTSDDGYSY